MSPHVGVKRFRERAGIFAAIAGSIAIVCGLCVGLGAFLTSTSTQGVRAGLAAVVGAEGGLRLSAPLIADTAAQDHGVRATIADEFRADGRPVPLEVTRTLDSLGGLSIFDGDAPVADADESTPSADVRSDAGLADVARLVDGAWSSADDEVTVQAGAAAALGYGVGDRIRIGDAVLTITGTWTAIDGLDPRWLGDQLVVDGTDDGDIGPIMVQEATWATMGIEPRVVWVLTPDPERVVVGDLAAITSGANSLPAAIKAAGFVPPGGSASQGGGLVRTVAELSTRVDAARAALPIALLIIIAIAAITLGELSRLLQATRNTETVLLRSRGASPFDTAVTTAAEATIAAAVGVLVGSATAALGLRLAVSAIPDDEVAASLLSAWPIPIVVFVVSVLIIAVGAYLAANRVLRRDTMEESGRRVAVGDIGVVVLVTIAAGISVWQFRLYGSPITKVQGGGTAIDPIAVVAPALALLCVALLAMMAFPPLARRAERLVTRSVSIATPLAARTIARRVTLAATPIVLVALTAGQLVVAAAYSETWETSYTQTRALRTGAPILVDAGADTLDPAAVEKIVATDGVDAVAPIRADDSQIGDDYISVVAASPRAVRDVALHDVGRAGGDVESFDGAAVATAITLKPVSIALPDDATRLTLSITASGFATPDGPGLSVILDDEYGRQQRVPLLADPAPLGSPGSAAPVDYTAELPTSSVPRQLTAIDVALPSNADETAKVSVAIDAASVDAGGATSDLDLDGWTVGVPGPGGPEAPDAADDGLGFTSSLARARETTVRLSPGSGPVGSPAAISKNLAIRYSIAIGDVLPLQLVDTERQLNAIVTTIVPVIPSADSGLSVLVDIAGLQRADLADRLELVEPTSLWVDSADPSAALRVLRDALPASVHLTAVEVDPSRPLLESAATALWIGAIGSLLLVIVAVGAVVAAQLRAREPEIAVLRAIGLASREQADVRRRELIPSLVYGAVLGLLAGLAVSALLIPDLARSAIPRPFSGVLTDLLVAPAPLGIGLLTLAVGLGAIVIVYGGRVAAQARDASTRGETR